MAASSKHSPAFPLLNLKGDFFKELPYNQGSVIAKGMSGDVVLVTCSDKLSEKRVLKPMPLKCRLSERAAKMLFMYELETFYKRDHRGLASLTKSLNRFSPFIFNSYLMHRGSATIMFEK